MRLPSFGHEACERALHVPPLAGGFLPQHLVVRHGLSERLVAQRQKEFSSLTQTALLGQSDIGVFYRENAKQQLTVQLSGLKDPFTPSHLRRFNTESTSFPRGSYNKVLFTSTKSSDTLIELNIFSIILIKTTYRQI